MTVLTLISDIEKQISDYLAIYPKEDLQQLLDQLDDERADNSWPYLVRSNMRGHITCSAFVVNESGEALLVDHIALKKWLQPGGHWEGDATLQDGAMREVVEETGMVCNIHDATPLDIDTHPIPANAKKHEGDHFHHDFCYLEVVRGDNQIIPQEAEVKGVKWAALDQVAQQNDRVGRMAQKCLDMI